MSKNLITKLNIESPIHLFSRVLIPFFVILILASCSDGRSKDEIGALYNEGRLNEALALLKDELKKTPDNAISNNMAGRILVDLQEYEKARPYLKKSLLLDKNRTWISAWALIALSKVEFTNGNIANAREYLEQSTKLEATRNSKKHAQELSVMMALHEDFDNWTSFETANIRFKFQPNSKVSDMKLYIEEREEALININEFFETKLPKKIDYIIWNGEDDANHYGINNLGFSRPELSIIHSKHNQTRGHEITHILTHHLSKPLKKVKFANEGIAVSFDQTDRDFLEMAINANVDLISVSIEGAWKNPNEYPDWVHYLVGGEFFTQLRGVGFDGKFKELTINQDYNYAKSLYGEKFIEIEASIEDALKIPPKNKSSYK